MNQKGKVKPKLDPGLPEKQHLKAEREQESLQGSERKSRPGVMASGTRTATPVDLSAEQKHPESTQNDRGCQASFFQKETT